MPAGMLYNLCFGLLTPVYRTSGLVTGEGKAAIPRVWAKARDLRDNKRNILEWRFKGWLDFISKFMKI